MGLAPDDIMWSGDNVEAHAEANERSGLNLPLCSTASDRGFAGNSVGQPYVGRGIGGIIYDPYLVLTRVVDDHTLGITDFYRGMDLITEMELYDFISRRCGFNPPTQGYLPTVRREACVGKESKSVGSIPIRALRAAGYSPGEIRRTLRACARDSVKAGRSEVLIPDGILDPDTYGVLRYNWAEEMWPEPVPSPDAPPQAPNPGRPYQKRMIERVESWITSDRGGGSDEPIGR